MEVFGTNISIFILIIQCIYYFFLKEGGYLQKHCKFVYNSILSLHDRRK